ncbi:Gfo/Idh/MocA family oxidoreductase [Sphingomonas sp. BT553]|uniref:Gfo/Idh/MocA family oxidoreductase n=2 Tax=Sphingomonas mollis TaxID=2795726 RepID=A0ABS0XKJ0_9SPHN|nr:Gfo/Idh/MocA family oxidoreductase [Sphingomonas sp. BT553]MBJ6120546.1 Gfo/Idh/MocA family oxidoreductase [Sphingomonas sp. BT553]
MMTIRLGLVGVGKIAHDQHIPTIAASPDFELVATASRHGSVEGTPSYSSIEEMLDGPETIDAITLCQPPHVRYDAARLAIASGKHVFLEKPPGMTLGEVAALAEQAETAGVSLFASWHSRYGAAIDDTRAWLAGTTIHSVKAIWKEDVRVWHPGQEWLWEAGALGVFDPGINALSVLTAILPRRFFLTDATLEFPENRAAPIAADLTYVDTAGVPVAAEFDFRQPGPHTWEVHAETAAGTMLLAKGGNELWIDGVLKTTAPEAEYRGLYDQFARLIAAGKSDADTTPLAHVTDAFLRGVRVPVEPFHY